LCFNRVGGRGPADQAATRSIIISKSQEQIKINVWKLKVVHAWPIFLTNVKLLPPPLVYNTLNYLFMSTLLKMGIVVITLKGVVVTPKGVILPKCLKITPFWSYHNYLFLTVYSYIANYSMHYWIIIARKEGSSYIYIARIYSCLPCMHGYSIMSRSASIMLENLLI